MNLDTRLINHGNYNTTISLEIGAQERRSAISASGLCGAVLFLVSTLDLPAFHLLLAIYVQEQADHGKTVWGLCVSVVSVSFLKCKAFWPFTGIISVGDGTVFPGPTLGSCSDLAAVIFLFEKDLRSRLSWKPWCTPQSSVPQCSDTLCHSWRAVLAWAAPGSSSWATLSFLAHLPSPECMLLGGRDLLGSSFVLSLKNSDGHIPRTCGG